jgi:hypothetical protein
MKDSMICITSVWNGQETFKVIPLVENCPYVEMIYDPEASMLVIISKIIKDAYHMIPKMDDKGDVVLCKNRKSADKTFAEERRLVESFQEYYLYKKDEVKDIISRFTINADNFDLSVLDKAPTLTTGSAQV